MVVVLRGGVLLVLALALALALALHGALSRPHGCLLGGFLDEGVLPGPRGPLLLGLTHAGPTAAVEVMDLQQTGESVGSESSEDGSRTLRVEPQRGSTPCPGAVEGLFSWGDLPW